MISKIAGYTDTQRIINGKLTDSFKKKISDNATKIVTENNIYGGLNKNFQQKQPMDFYIAESYKVIPKKIKLLVKKS